MPTRQSIPSLSRRKIHRAALTFPLAATFGFLLALPACVSAAPAAGSPNSVALEQKLAALEAIVRKQQVLIETQSSLIKSLQGQLRNIVTHDGAGNVVIPGSLHVGRTAQVGEDVKAGRHVLVGRQLAVGENLAIGKDLVVDRSLLVKGDLVVQRNLSGSAAAFSTVNAAAVKANLGDFDVLRAANGKFRFPSAP